MKEMMINVRFKCLDERYDIKLVGYIEDIPNEIRKIIDNKHYQIEKIKLNNF